jgi:hypothetical protein
MVGMSAPDGGTVEQYLDELYGRLRSGALVALVMAAAFALQLNRALLRRARG